MIIVDPPPIVSADSDARHSQHAFGVVDPAITVSADCSARHNQLAGVFDPDAAVASDSYVGQRGRCIVVVVESIVDTVSLVPVSSRAPGTAKIRGSCSANGQCLIAC